MKKKTSHLWLIYLIGIIVPQRLRADWRQEWEAELQHRETVLADWDKLNWQSRLNLLWRSTSAFWDALWLLPKRWEDEMMQDLRFGMRMLLKSTAFTLGAILSLAIGIGANTALFSVVQAVLLRPLPYPQAERLVRVEGHRRAAEFVALGELPNVFDGVAAWASRDYTLTGQGVPEQLKGQQVSAQLLPLLGVAPVSGRAFAAAEFQPGRNLVALISQRLWRTRFGADPQVIGQAVTLDERRYTVVGILPARFDFFPSADLLTPLAFTAGDLSEENYFGVELIARLKAEVTLAQAQAQAATLIRRAASSEAFELHQDLRLQPLREFVVKDFRVTLLVLWGVVGCVLLIACANFANLLLARAAHRQKELAVRAALGARPGRLVRQLLTESVLVAALGGAAGLSGAYFGVQALLAANPAILPRLSLAAGMATIPRLGEVVLDGWALAFTFVLALVTGVLFGLVPALQFSRPELGHALKEGAAVSLAGYRFGRHRRMQSLLVIGEIALALVLLIGAGLLIRSFWQLQQVEPGFRAAGLLTLQLEFPQFKYKDGAQVNTFVTQLSERVAALPGVVGVGAADSLPLRTLGSFGSISIEGQPNLVSRPEDLPFGVAPPPPPPGTAGAPSFNLGPSAFFSKVSPAYFRTLGIPLRQGREFELGDNQRSQPVIIINEAMARRYWPNENPLGQRLSADGSDAWRTVVGVVGNVRRFALEDQTSPEFYLPLLQPLEEPGNSSSPAAVASHKPKPAAKAGRKAKPESQAEDSLSFRAVLRPSANSRLAEHISLVVRTTGRPVDVAEAVRQAVWSLDPEQPILQLDTMQARLAEIFAPRRFNMLLFGVFACVALLLAAVGIYGVLAYAVAERTHEMGIRLALGAQSRDVLRLVIGHGMRLTLVGLTLGLAAALALTPLLKNLLFGVSASDPLTFAAIAVILAGVALLACYLPARRATKVDPLVALRHE